MNKAIIFVSGIILGAAGGSAVTYYMVNAKRDEELEEYSEHCQERIEKFRKKYEKEDIDKIDEGLGQKLTNDPEEEKIINNEGVKKYHVRPATESKYGENRVFTTAQSDKDRKDIKKEINKSVKEKDSKLIEDIDEETYLNDEEPYTRHVVDVLLGDDLDIVGFWGYQTDNEMFIEDKYGKDLEELLGIVKEHYGYLISQVDEDDGIGHIYVRNNEIMIDFEVVIHDMREDDK